MKKRYLFIEFNIK
jgi:hypothetical protein